MITFDITGRKLGKTKRLIEWMEANPDGILLTTSLEMTKVIIMRAPHLRGRVYSYRQELPDGKPPRKVAIDDLEHIIKDLLGIAPQDTIERISATGRLETDCNCQIGEVCPVHDSWP